jgi:hypothetical protein
MASGSLLGTANSWARTFLASVRFRAAGTSAAAAGADAVLVGEALMRAPFPEDVLEDLVGVPKCALPTVR